jgi:CheY-like chemotaxis protein
MTVARERVLVVDDSEPILEMTEGLLRDAGYQVELARSGEEGLARARAHEPSLILLDVQMPGMNGWQVCEALKADPALGRVPIVFMTGVRDADDIVRGLEMGAADYVTKPFHGRVLVQRVTTALRAYRAQEEQRRLAEARAEALAALADAHGHGLAARKLAGLATMASGLARELGPPVAAAAAALARLRDGPGGGSRDESTLADEQRAWLAQAAAHLADAEAVLGRLRRLGQDLETNATAPLSGIVAAIVAPMAEALAARGVVLTPRVADTPAVRGAARLGAVVSELVTNAARAVADGGHIEVETCTDGAWAVLVVTDDGCGMALPPGDAALPRLHRASAPGEAKAPVVGLGLAMCHAIVGNLGGTLDLESAPGAGTRVRVRVPGQAEADPARSELPSGLSRQLDRAPGLPRYRRRRPLP